MRFTYRSGDRPLDGYTIKRGVGRGAFGEVYFAISDGGKEVALKLLQGHSDVELRGIGNCLNLKHGNLVHVYDLLTDDKGDHWIVMEYVLGESLSQVIARHPTGLQPNLAKEWFVSLVQAVGYLHDNGVVHRDLKPANIFVENGQIKLGDYGLCKSLHSAHKRQTRMVGTLQYMAPEVSNGNYGKGIDLYACGIILHEMLTGKLPFDGESDGEILAKHLTAPPDLSSVPAAFRGVLAKALEKNPLRRFQTAVEMKNAVEAAMLPMASPVVVPQPVAAAVGADPGPFSVPVAAAAAPPLVAEPVPPKQAVPLPPPVANRVNQPTPIPAKVLTGPSFRDWLTDLTGGMLKAPIAIAIALLPFALFMPTTAWDVGSKLFLVTTLLSWGMLIGAGRAKYKASDTWTRRLQLAGIGAVIGVLAFWIHGWSFPPPGSEALPAGQAYPTAVMQAAPEEVSTGLRYVLYFAAVLGIGRWWKATARDRKERFRLFPSIAAAFWGSLLMFLWPWQAGPVWAGVVPVVLAALAVQTASPWDAPKPTAPKKLRYRPA